MIYLIGGPPRAGKTILSKKLSRKLHIPCISVDTLEGIVKAHTPKDKIKTNYPKDEIRNKTKHSNDVMYTRYSSREIMRAYVRQAKSSWKAIELFVEAEVVEGNDYILEGHQIHPALAAKFKKKYPDDIREIFLIQTDPARLVRDALKNKAKNDWFIKKTKDPNTYMKIAEMLCLYGMFIKKEADMRGLCVVSADDFHKTMTGAISLLLV